MSHLPAMQPRRVTPALRPGVGCAVGRCHQDVRLSGGVPRPVAKWHTAAAISLEFPHLHSPRLVRGERRRCMPALRATSATSVFSTVRSAPRFAFGLGLVDYAHTATSR